jgi:hypothetical protein
MIEEYKLDKVAKCFEMNDAEKFNDHVSHFLNSKGILDFSNLFQEPSNKYLIEFLQDDLVVSYLSRKASTMKFYINEPVLESSYENNLYIYLKSKLEYFDKHDHSTKAAAIPARISQETYQRNQLENIDKITYPSSLPFYGFYKQGIFKEKIQFIINKLNIQSINTNSYVVKDPEITADIYGVASFLAHLKNQESPEMRYNSKANIEERELLLEHNKETKVDFVISANMKDWHATTILTILDDNQKPILSALINSNDRESYYEYLKYRFDSITTLDTPGIPFIHTPYNLQTEPTDQNCIIYSLNNIKAIINMVSEPETSSQLIKLASSSDFEGFKSNFLLNLKKHLPQYFICTDEICIDRDLSEIAEYHAREKWDIGSDYIKNYLCEDAVEIVGEL